MKGIVILILAFIGCLKAQQQIDLNEHPHSYYVSKKHCNIISNITYKHHYTLINLKCKWHPFIESFSDANRTIFINQNQQSKKKLKNIYDLEFHSDAVSLPKSIFTKLTKDLFKNFIIRRLSLKNLKLDTIEENAFANAYSFRNLEFLDLSDNNLRRIDVEALVNLPNLKILNLSKNQLYLADRNFKSNKYLNIIDLSNNDLQYLPENVFDQLNLIERIDLSNNNLKTVEACTFNSIQMSEIANKYTPAIINLNKNPIRCDCDLFYLNRYRNFKLDLKCEMPDYYRGKQFNELKYENPSPRCKYDNMESKCNSKSTTRDLVLIIIFAVLLLIFLISLCYCCCRNMSLTKQLDRLNKKARYFKEQNIKNQNNSNNLKDDRINLVS